ncbi:hypothetical protein JCM6882_000780 [Rhodosporidiobolus microsporus]
MSTAPPQRECWVCGKATTTRCGPCGEAGVEIFFCSREHQKRVWPIHKLVCGPGKAHPFVWPLLSPEEADFACAHLFNSLPTGPFAGAALGPLLWRFMEIQPEETEAQDNDKVLAIVRTAMHALNDEDDISSSSSSSATSPDHTSSVPCPALSQAQSFWMDLRGGQHLPGEARLSHWTSLFLHRLLFFCTSVNIPGPASTATMTQEARTAITHAFQALESLLEHEGAPTDPKFEQRFNESVGEHFVAIAQVYAALVGMERE